MKLFYATVYYIFFSKLSVFTGEPQDDIIFSGTKNYSIACSVNSSINNSKPKIVWKHNNTAITDFNNKHFSVKSDGTLNFVQFLQRDIGFYQCIAILYGKDGNQKIDQISSRVAHIQIACKYQIMPDYL